MYMGAFMAKPFPGKRQIAEVVTVCNVLRCFELCIFSAKMLLCLHHFLKLLYKTLDIETLLLIAASGGCCLKSCRVPIQLFVTPFGCLSSWAVLDTGFFECPLQYTKSSYIAFPLMSEQSLVIYFREE